MPSAQWAQTRATALKTTGVSSRRARFSPASLTNKGIAEVGNSTTGYYHEAATDLIGGPASTGYITFGGKSSGNPYTAAIESVVKFTAPFDVVVYIGNGNNGSKAIVEPSDLDRRPELDQGR